MGDFYDFDPLNHMATGEDDRDYRGGSYQYKPKPFIAKPVVNELVCECNCTAHPFQPCKNCSCTQFQPKQTGWTHRKYY